MKTAWFFLLCWASISLLLPGLSDAQVDAFTLLAVGDSITQGLARKYDGDGGKIVWGITSPRYGAVTTGWGYPIELDIIIETELPDLKGWRQPVSATVYNWGHMGFTSIDSLDCEKNPRDCLDTVLASHADTGGADFILIMFGANDAAGYISERTLRANLKLMIDKSRAAGVEPVLGTITPNTDKHAAFPVQNIAFFYNPQIRELATEENVLLADHYTSMVGNWKTLYTSGDGLHLSQTGNKKMARTWFEALSKSTLFDPPPPPVVAPWLHLLLRP